MRRSVRLVIAATIALTVGVVPSPAAAHDDAGQIALVGTGIGVEAMTGDFVVDVSFQNDGHGAPAATVTLVAEDGAGNRIGPVAMSATQPDGRYAGSLTFPAPGAWTVRVTSLSPSASLEVPFVVMAPPTSTTSAPATSAPTPPGGSTTSGVGQPATEDAATTSDSTSGGSGLLLVVIGVLVVALLGGGFAAWKARTDSSNGARQ